MGKKAKIRSGKRPKASVAPAGPLLRWGPMVVGAMFLVAGLGKVFDPWSFYSALPGYGVEGPLQSLLAAVLPAFEVALGVALVARWGVRQTSLLAVAFLTVFVAAISYGWWQGTLQECGCFGPFLKRSPRDALFIDLGFLALAAVIWNRARGGRAVLQGWHKAVLGFVGVVALMLNLSLLQVGPSGVQAAISVSLNEEMRAVELERGEHLLYLFHHECPHCADMTPLVAAYAREGGLPPVAGFTFRTSQRQIDRYRDKYDLRIPVQVLPGETFTQITGEGSVPQLVYVQEGELKRTWIGLLPPAAELRRALRGID